jgi:zinc transporter ZupT
MSLAAALKAKDTSTKYSLIIQFCFALTESTGCAIGIGLGDAPPLLTSCIYSICGGTFIYIGCSEILVEEFSKKGYKVVKFLLFLLGAAIIIVLWFTEA